MRREKVGKGREERWKRNKKGNNKEEDKDKKEGRNVKTDKKGEDNQQIRNKYLV